MPSSSTSFSSHYQPLKRTIIAHRGLYWKAIPLEAFSIQARLALGSIPINQWWLRFNDPDDLDLIQTHLTIAQVITPREDGAWQVRNSCRHLVHTARQWTKSHEALKTFPPEVRERFDPINESLTQVDKARQLYALAFHPVPDVFPGCPAAYAQLRGLR